MNQHESKLYSIFGTIIIARRFVRKIASAVDEQNYY